VVGKLLYNHLWILPTHQSQGDQARRPILEQCHACSCFRQDEHYVSQALLAHLLTALEVKFHYFDGSSEPLALGRLHWINRLHAAVETCHELGDDHMMDQVPRPSGSGTQPWIIVSFLALTWPHDATMGKMNRRNMASTIAYGERRLGRAIRLVREKSRDRMNDEERKAGIHMRI